MATLTATSRLKPVDKGGGVLKYQLPFVLKKFVIEWVRDLSIDDRAAFRFMCRYDVPESRLSENIERDGNIFKLVEFLIQDGRLSVKDVSYLKRFLPTIGREDWLQRLEKVELRMFIGNIVEDYVKLKAFARQDGGASDAACCCDIVVALLVETKTRNKCLIEEILGHLSAVDGADDGIDSDIVDGVFLRICNKIMSSHRSWFGLVACLVIIVGLYGSYSRYLGTPVDVALDGYYVCAFSGTKTSQLLAEWILENGGRETFQKFVRLQRRELDSGSDISEVLSEMRRILQNCVAI
ncbi:uncharacterized protein LOC111342232 [Stylophora pistillata]|uniref:DED domain-containing protein n=1 Tax=Stylophora pistillata TaxID=50429 RepID=A0A2B4RHZ9_STYPI|nr:uncharacterized protein LOC111342232 [Stylophora pistillata]PFX16423.1 hypothetical protein AWC38_SpisGene19304 [Stylophora pistillata]